MHDIPQNLTSTYYIRMLSDFSHPIFSNTVKYRTQNTEHRIANNRTKTTKKEKRPSTILVIRYRGAEEEREKKY